jgi:hypothetical protein
MISEPVAGEPESSAEGRTSRAIGTIGAEFGDPVGPAPREGPLSGCEGRSL